MWLCNAKKNLLNCTDHVLPSTAKVPCPALLLNSWNSCHPLRYPFYHPVLLFPNFHLPLQYLTYTYSTYPVSWCNILPIHTPHTSPTSPEELTPPPELGPGCMYLYLRRRGWRGSPYLTTATITNNTTAVTPPHPRPPPPIITPWSTPLPPPATSTSTSSTHANTANLPRPLFTHFHTNCNCTTRTNPTTHTTPALTRTISSAVALLLRSPPSHHTTPSPLKQLLLLHTNVHSHQLHHQLHYHHHALSTLAISHSITRLSLPSALRNTRLSAAYWRIVATRSNPSRRGHFRFPNTPISTSQRHEHNRDEVQLLHHDGAVADRVTIPPPTSHALSQTL